MNKLRKIIIMIALLILCLLTGCYEENTPIVTNPPVNEYISDIKNGTIGNTGITLGESFDSFFAYPNYTYFISNDDRQIIQFTGNCRVTNYETQVIMQFSVNNSYNTQNPTIYGQKNKYEMIYIEYDGITWGTYGMVQMLDAVIDSYNRSPKYNNSY